MHAVILAAGAGVRMRPLTLTTPKPLVRVRGKALLDHIFEALPSDVTDAVIVVKYLGEQIKQYCGALFHGRTIAYAEGSPLGSAYSFLAAKPYVTDDRFLFLYGDEFPSSDDIRACLSFPASILCWDAPDPWNHGVALLRPDGTIRDIVEKPAHPSGALIADGVMVLNQKIFDYVPEKNANGEFFFTGMVRQFVQRERVVAVRSRRAIGGISTMADVERLNSIV